MPAGSVTVSAAGVVTKDGLAGAIYDARVLSLAEVDPPGVIPPGAVGVPIKQGLAADANALASVLYGGTLPTGAVLPFAGSTAPDGFLFCDGKAYSRATYEALFTAIGTTYGVGDGSTTFNVPDLRARAPIGVNAAGLPNGANGSFSTRAAGATGGAETHTLTSPEMPTHAHGSATLIYSAGGSGALAISPGAEYGIGGSTDTVGGGGAHNNMMPFLALNFVIKT